MTNHTATLRQLTNVGEDAIWEAKVATDLIASGDTIDISSCSALVTGNGVSVVYAQNITDGTVLTNDMPAGGVASQLKFTVATGRFTIQGTKNSSDEVRVGFIIHSA